MRSGEKLRTEYALKRHPFADSDGIDTLQDDSDPKSTLQSDGHWCGKRTCGRMCGGEKESSSVRILGTIHGPGLRQTPEEAPGNPRALPAGESAVAGGPEPEAYHGLETMNLDCALYTHKGLKREARLRTAGLRCCKC